MKRLKIKDARIPNKKMFQEDQGMFYRKTLGMKQLKRKVPRMEKFEEFWVGIWKDNTKTPNRKWMNTVAKKNGTKSCKCAGICNHRKDVAPNSQETKELVCSWD